MAKYVEILNGNIILASKAKYLEHFLPKLKGLMFTLPLRKGKGIILVAPGEGILETMIHMLFVFYPLDIVWLDSNYEVVDFRKMIMPFTPFVAPNKPAKYVLELSHGSIKHIKIGDKLMFKDLEEPKSKHI
jgi:uncharacterized membrane protein (UPF0127 family)